MVSMIIIATFVLGLLSTGLRSPRTCLLIAVALGLLSGAGGDWLQMAAVIGGYNMGVALALCGAIVADVYSDR